MLKLHSAFTPYCLPYFTLHTHTHTHTHMHTHTYTHHTTNTPHTHTQRCFTVMDRGQVFKMMAKYLETFKVRDNKVLLRDHPWDSK